MDLKKLVAFTVDTKYVVDYRPKIQKIRFGIYEWAFVYFPIHISGGYYERPRVVTCYIFCGKKNRDCNNCGIYGRTFAKGMPSYGYLGQLDW